MKIGDAVFVRGVVDEIRKDVVIIRNDGGYFGTVPSEIFVWESQIPKTNMEIIDPVDLVRDLTEKIGIHQLYAITVDLRGEPIQQTGEWIDRDGGIATCSACGDRWGVWDTMNYCPTCGTKMIERIKDQNEAN